MNDTDDIERIIFAVRDLGNNSKEIVYKHLRKNVNEKIANLQKIKRKIDETMFSIPLSKRKRQVLEEKKTSSNSSIENEMVKQKEMTSEIKQDPVCFSEYSETDEEEYDPYIPNDYEKIKAEINMKKLAKEFEEKKLKNLNSKYKKKSAMDKIIIGETAESKKNKKETSENKARKMLEKMGWKGQGLGKYEQGIINPLIAIKTTGGFGIIINSNIQNEEKKIDIKNFYNRPPTKILMITNMVYPDEICPEMYNDIKQECEKFGNLLEIKFFHFIAGELPPGESVRVFLEYDNVNSAILAFEKLYDRYFSERIIRVKFYNESLYNKNILNSCNYS